MEGDVSQSPGKNPGRRQAFWDQTAGSRGESGWIFEGPYHGQVFFLPDGMPPLKE